MCSAGVSSIVVQTGHCFPNVKPCPERCSSSPSSSSPSPSSSTMMTSTMTERSLGIGTASPSCRGAGDRLTTRLQSTRSKIESVLCQTSDVTSLRKGGFSRLRLNRRESVEAVWIRSLQDLSSATSLISGAKPSPLSSTRNSFPSLASPSRSSRLLKSRRLSVYAQAQQQSNSVQEVATEQRSHSHGAILETSSDGHTFASVLSAQEKQLRPEVDFGEGNGALKSSAEYVENNAEKEAWALLRSSIVSYYGSPVGTIAAQDPTSTAALNYDQVFIRDFIPSAIAFLLKGETEIVKEFLLNTLRLQSWEKTVDCYNPGQGLMPASFKVRTVPLDGDDPNATEEILDPDFGEAAIGRVAPVDSGLWWIILLRAYGKSSGDYALQERIEVQTGMKMILKLCLADGFDMFPTLLVTDGSCMIDRRMGIHGHPLEIQALFYSALRCGREMLIDEDETSALTRSINSRLSALLFHVREYYWVDMRKLNEIYRYQTEEYSHDAVNKFNIYPDQIPRWLLDWMPDQGGYLIGNVQPAHMDFRFFTLGNLWSVVGSLANEEQSAAILDLMEAKWKDFVGHMPLKICFPALECEEWRIITGADPKNTPWSYHNSGSWPVLLWQFTVACIKMGKLDLAQRVVEVAERNLSKDQWPEYYDTRSGRLIGKQARLQQTWTIAGFLVSKMLIRNPQAVSILTNEEDWDLLEVSACSLENSPRKQRGKKQILV